MFVKYYKEYSFHLKRDMEFKVYGEGGIPFIVFPSQNGKFYDFEDNGMVKTVEKFIDEKKIQLFCVQSVDEESWSANGDEHGRIYWHEQWFDYICNEFIPRLYQIHNETSKEFYTGKVMTTGASMGGYHAVNFFLRRPDLFQGCISLSGLFHATYFFPNYQDELVYHNSPTDFMKNMDIHHPYVPIYRNRNIIICCGQGAWENEAIEDAHILKEQFERLNVPAWIDFWGYDVNHDWPWWRVQLPYFIERFLEDAH